MIQDPSHETTIHTNISIDVIHPAAPNAFPNLVYLYLVGVKYIKTVNKVNMINVTVFIFYSFN
jgi:hypothetical protein